MQRITKYIQIICNRKRLSRDNRLRLMMMEHERALTPCRSSSSRNREAISGTVIDYMYKQTIPARASLRSLGRDDVKSQRYSFRMPKSDKSDFGCHFIVGILKSAPPLMPDGQREVTVLVLV
jgi:hypothetical protein